MIFLTVFGCTAFGQTDRRQCVSEIDFISGERIYTFVDELPVPKDGQQFLFRQLGKSLKFTNFKIDDPGAGSLTIVSFVINENGKITNKEIVREDFPEHSIAEQMLNIVESIEWTPGTCNAVPVKVRHILPLRTCFTR